MILIIAATALALAFLFGDPLEFDVVGVVVALERGPVPADAWAVDGGSRANVFSNTRGVGR